MYLQIILIYMIYILQSLVVILVFWLADSIPWFIFSVKSLHTQAKWRIRPVLISRFCKIKWLVVFWWESWKDWPLLHGLPTDSQTTLWTTLRTTLRPSPWTTQNKQTNLCLLGKEAQAAYLLHVHNHNCMKNSRHLFADFLNLVFFHFSPISSSATNQYQ